MRAEGERERGGEEGEGRERKKRGREAIVWKEPWGRKRGSEKGAHRSKLVDRGIKGWIEGKGRERKWLEGKVWWEKGNEKSTIEI